MNFFTKKNIRIHFSYKDYKKKGRFFIEKKLKKINLKNIIYFFPFIFSLIEIISFKYKKKNFLFLFEKNFSIRNKFEEKILWETFDLFKIKESFFVDTNRNIKKYSVYNDYFLIEVKKKNLFSSLGFIKKNNVNLQKKVFKNSKFLIRSDNLIFFSTFKNKIFYKNFINFFNFETFIYDIDILPIKINEIDVFLEKNNNFFFIKKKFLKKNFIQINKNNKFLPSNLNTKTPFFLKNKEKKNNCLLFKGTKEKIYFCNISKLEKKTFFYEKKIFQKKLNLLFYKNKFFYFKNNNENSNFIKTNFFIFPKNDIINSLDVFFQKKQINFINPRFISGYNYVDYKKNDKFFILQNTFFKNKKYKIIFPFDFLYFFNQKFFLFSENFYFLNLNRLKNNFNGFNLNFSDSQIIEDLIVENNLKNIFFKKTKKTILKKNKKIRDFSVKNFSLLLEIKKKQKIMFLEEKKIILQKNLFFNFIVKQIINKNVFFEIQPYSQKLFEENFKINKYYFLNKQNFSLLREKSQKNNLYFSQNWESFSSSSWLLITRFIVSFFLLKIIKDVYKDYGKELLQFLIEFGNSTEIDLDSLKEQYLIENPDYRIIQKTKKNFKNIVGIDFLLSETGEILSLLKNYGRSAKYKKTIPKGILLTGPPGTGKTLLVQAISGEAKVPVIVQSASLLIDPNEKGRSSKKLKKIFEKARSYSPCIIFIDEIDSLGAKRQKFFQLGSNSDKVIESIYEKKQIEKNFSFFDLFEKRKKNSLDTKAISNESNTETNSFFDSSKQLDEQKTKLNLLTQFLIEMDGLKNRKGIFVFGATNRLEILDPALIRPGRFDKIINLPAPSKKKRIQILKFYSKKRKIEKKISWNYLANRMINCSAADIAAIMNESAIQSIIQNTTHTVETIEKGINYITSYSIVKNKKINLLQNKSYFQSGKALSYILFSEKQKEKGIFLSLWDRKKNTRHGNNFDFYFFEKQTRKNLEFVLLSSHFGKVGELLFLFGKKNEKLKYFESDYGHEERLLISFLTNFLIENWFFYSTKIFLRRENQTLSNFSMLEKTQYNVVLSKLFENEIELEKKKEISNIGKFQQQNFSVWWEQEISKRISANETFFNDWYRLFLPDPEESLLNLEWIPPDLIIHNNKILKKLGKKSNINFNNLYKIQRDFIFQSLILNAFEIAFSKEETLRQFLDFFADQLLCYGIIRDIEIENIYKLKK